MDNERRTFVATVAAQHGRRLRRFLAARLRNAADVPDIAQEVYLRLLRIERHDRIRSPEAYLFTVASHLLYEHALRQSAAPVVVEIADVVAELNSPPEDDPEHRAETQLRIQELGHAVDQLSPKVQATLMLHRRDGYTLEEISEQLGVSRHTVKKYLAKALVHCRQRMERE